MHQHLTVEQTGQEVAHHAEVATPLLGKGQQHGHPLDVWVLLCLYIIVEIVPQDILQLVVEQAGHLTLYLQEIAELERVERQEGLVQQMLTPLEFLVFL